MTDNDPLRQLQACIAEMERHHEKELRKLKADHDDLEACVKHLEGDKHSAHTINEHTQGELNPHQTNTLDDNHISHVHRHEGRMT